MDDNIKQVEDLLTKLRSDMKQAVEEAYNRGWDDGIATTPDYAKFHEAHQEPQEYGEDGEIVVISGKVDMEEAVDKIYALVSGQWGQDSTRDDIFNQLHAEKVAMATGDQEYDYYVGKDRNGIFDAWIWRA